MTRKSVRIDHGSQSVVRTLIVLRGLFEIGRVMVCRENKLKLRATRTIAQNTCANSIRTSSLLGASGTGAGCPRAAPRVREKASLGDRNFVGSALPGRARMRPADGSIGAEGTEASSGSEGSLSCPSLKKTQPVSPEPADARGTAAACLANFRRFNDGILPVSSAVLEVASEALICAWKLFFASKRMRTYRSSLWRPPLLLLAPRL